LRLVIPRVTMVRRLSTSSDRTRIDAFKASSELLLREGFRSKLEQKGAEQLTKAGIEWKYEKEKLDYVVPERKAKYLPDFVVGDGNNRLYLEFKGWPFEAEDRQKMIHVRDQHPEKDIRIVFHNANQKLYTKSKSTVGEWASEHGFAWSDKVIVPTSWIEEVR